MKIKIIFILLFSCIIFPSDNNFNLLKTETLSWGSNFLGQLGTGKNSTIDVPVQTIDASDVIKISSGKYHTLILKKDGTVWAFGRNREGQLGDGTHIDKSYPVQVGNLVGYDENLNPILEPLSNIIDISAGAYHSLALKNDGTLFAWGITLFSQAGYCIDSWKNPHHSEFCRPYACEIYSIPDIWKISAGSIVSIFLKKDGTVWGIGRDSYGQLQYDTSYGGAITAYPVRISNLDNVIYISAGEGHVMAVRNTGEVYCWGNNELGQVGDGTHSSYKKQQRQKI